MDDGWDAAIPGPCVLLHRRSTDPTSGQSFSTLLVANPDGKQPELHEGESFVSGEADDPFAAYTRITVTRIDRNNREALVDVHIRKPRQIEPAGTPLFGDATGDGGGWIWTPGRGLVKVPPRSPLFKVLELVSDYETLQSISFERSNLMDKLTWF